MSTFPRTSHRLPRVPVSPYAKALAPKRPKTAETPTQAPTTQPEPTPTAQETVEPTQEPRKIESDLQVQTPISQEGVEQSTEGPTELFERIPEEIEKPGQLLREEAETTQESYERTVQPQQSPKAWIEKLKKPSRHAILIPDSVGKDVIDVIRGLFGVESTSLEQGGHTNTDLIATIFASCAGAPDGSGVDISDVSKVHWGRVITIHITNPVLQYCSRSYFLADHGEKVVINDEIEIVRGLQNSGIGSTIFYNQVENVASLGYSRIETNALSEGNQNGAHTWPLLGYDADIETLADFLKKYQIRDITRAFPRAESLLDIISTPHVDLPSNELEKFHALLESQYERRGKQYEPKPYVTGREWWCGILEKWISMEEYVEIPLEFDLREGSRSRQVLDAYMQERQRRASVRREGKAMNILSDNQDRGGKGRENIDLAPWEEDALDRAWELLSRKRNSNQINKALPQSNSPFPNKPIESPEPGSVGKVQEPTQPQPTTPPVQSAQPEQPPLQAVETFPANTIPPQETTPPQPKQEVEQEAPKTHEKKPAKTSLFHEHSVEGWSEKIFGQPLSRRKFEQKIVPLAGLDILPNAGLRIDKSDSAGVVVEVADKSLREFRLTFKTDVRGNPFIYNDHISAAESGTGIGTRVIYSQAEAARKIGATCGMLATNVKNRQIPSVKRPVLYMNGLTTWAFLGYTCPISTMPSSLAKALHGHLPGAHNLLEVIDSPGGAQYWEWLMEQGIGYRDEGIRLGLNLVLNPQDDRAMNLGRMFINREGWFKKRRGRKSLEGGHVNSLPESNDSEEHYVDPGITEEELKEILGQPTPEELEEWKRRIRDIENESGEPHQKAHVVFGTDTNIDERKTPLSGDKVGATGNVFGATPMTRLKKPLEYGTGQGVNSYQFDAPEHREKSLKPPREYSMTKVELKDASYVRSQGSPVDKVKRILADIQEDDLHEKGKEEDSHITCVFGLHEDTPTRVIEVVREWVLTRGSPRDITARLGDISVFPAEEGQMFDVLKLDVESDDLRSLNEFLRNRLEHTDTHEGWTSS